MPTADESELSGREPSRRWLRSILVTLAILLGLSATVWLFVDATGRSALRKQLAALKAAGEPLSLAEWEARRPELADEENSARVILSVRDQIEALHERDERFDRVPLLGKAKLPLWGEPWPADMVEATDEFLEMHAELLAALDPIHDLPRGRFPFDLKANPLAVLLPNLAPLRTAAKLEILAALREAAGGEVNGALARCRTMLHMGASLREEPAIISSLVSMATDTLAVTTVERVLALGSSEADSLAALQELVWDHETHPAIHNGLRGERIFQLEMLDYVRRKGPRALSGMVPSSGIESWPTGLTWALGGWVRLNQAKALELMGPLIEALDSQSKAMDAVDTKDKALQSLGFEHALAKMLTPSLSRSVTLWARHTAELRCARAGLAAERFRLATGRWPETLKELVPEYLQAVPLDPFDEKPLRYKVEADRVVIYSIGENEVDDGGQLVHPERPHATPPDTGFRLLNPELRGFKIAEPE